MFAHLNTSRDNSSSLVKKKKTKEKKNLQELRSQSRNQSGSIGWSVRTRVATDASRAGVTGAQSRWEKAEKTYTACSPSLHSFSPNMHSASKQSHPSIYHSFLFSAGYLRGSLREGPSLRQPFHFLDGAQGCKSEEKKKAVTSSRSVPCSKSKI